MSSLCMASPIVDSTVDMAGGVQTDTVLGASFCTLREHREENSDPWCRQPSRHGAQAAVSTTGIYPLLIEFRTLLPFLCYACQKQGAHHCCDRCSVAYHSGRECNNTLPVLPLTCPCTYWAAVAPQVSHLLLEVLEDSEDPRDRGSSQSGVGLERVRSGSRADPKWFGAGPERVWSGTGAGVELVGLGVCVEKIPSGPERVQSGTGVGPLSRSGAGLER
mmetsp:Transcript_127241/g.220153  ORF Transcript_127241/g.220153 Transcript_127241/m.220153 type:complete len:219 (-) Transcript_127241:1005-1661(-)